MRIFIGKISPSINSTQVLEYFKTFGPIDDFVFKGSYAFIETSDDIGSKILNQREHNINGSYVIVDNSIPKKNDISMQNRDTFSYKDRNLHEDNYYNDRNRNMYSFSNEYRKFSHQPNYDDSRFLNYNDPNDRFNCPYCSKCTYHGVPFKGDGGFKTNNNFDRQDFDNKRYKRGHPNDVNKIVIQDFPFNVSICDLEDFVKKFGFEIIFSRMTSRGDCAILELKSIQDKFTAIQKLNGIDFCGSKLYVREFKTFGIPNSGDKYVEKNDFIDNKMNNKSEDDEQGVDIYSGLDTINLDQ